MRNMENIASSVGSIAQYRFSLSRKVMPWTTLWVNNYGYESKRRRKKIYFWVYGSISFFTIFVECQEHGLQQHNGKKKNNTNICFANIDIYRYFRLLIKISRLKNLILCILTSEKNWSGWKILKKKSGTGADDVVEPTLWYFEEMKFLICQEEPCMSLNTIQIGEEGEQESEEVDNVGDTSAINTISVGNHFISYSYCSCKCMLPWNLAFIIKKKNCSNHLWQLLHLRVNFCSGSLQWCWTGHLFSMFRRWYCLTRSLQYLLSPLKCTFVPGFLINNCANSNVLRHLFGLSEEIAQ